jgi:hypothetical protein
VTEKSMSDQERDMLRLLVSGEDDAEGLLAFALHRRAFFDFAEAYRKAEGVEPDATALKHFMLGETADRRLKEYRERANLLLSLPPETAGAAAAVSQDSGKTPEKTRPKTRTWFWPWGFPSTFAIDAPDQPINWKGLAARLLLLMLAVIVTALLLRILFVRNI